MKLDLNVQLCCSVLWHCWLGLTPVKLLLTAKRLAVKAVPEMTYNVLSVTLNSTVPMPSRHSVVFALVGWGVWLILPFKLTLTCPVINVEREVQFGHTCTMYLACHIVGLHVVGMVDASKKLSGGVPSLTAQFSRTFEVGTSRTSLLRDRKDLIFDVV